MWSWLGPALASAKTCRALAEELLKSQSEVVLDAALLHSLKPAKSRTGPPILLPHAGELSSLLDCRDEEIDEDPLGCGLRAASLYNAIVLVKGVTSHVVAPDGRAWIYKGALPASAFRAAVIRLRESSAACSRAARHRCTALLWGVLLHGEAGEALTKKVGPIGFLAREIPDELPALLAR